MAMSHDRVYFQGLCYGFSQGYYRRNNRKGGPKFLHRAIWESERGPVPEGCSIHHIDHDTRNNDISNLACVPSTEHHSYHGKKNMEVGDRRYRLADWMRTPKGRELARRVNAENRAAGKYDGKDKSAFYAARDAWIKTDAWKEICSRTTRERQARGEFSPPTDECRARAAEWHRSEAGRAWHRDHAKQAWKNRTLTQCHCQHCGKPFMSPYPSHAKFCGPNCKARALRA